MKEKFREKYCLELNEDEKCFIILNVKTSEANLQKMIVVIFFNRYKNINYIRYGQVYSIFKSLNSTSDN